MNRRKPKSAPASVRRFEQLEPRLLLSYATLDNGMPILDSRPDAPAAIFLDFDGDPTIDPYGSATTPYSDDGDSTTFNTTEANNIAECWRQMSIYYAMFDVNVTTVQPNVSTTPTAWVAIGNNKIGGYSYIGSFPETEAQSWDESNDARNRVSAIAHEIGHNFGLYHQSTYNLSGSKTAEYSSGYDALHGPLMGSDTAGLIHKWIIGHPSSSPSALQDDMSVIANRINAFAGGGYTGDGYAPDDFGGTIATAAPLIVNGGVQSITGVIERLTDTDAFSFTVSAAGQYLVRAARDVPSGVDLRLSLYNFSGVLLAMQDGDPLAQPLGVNNNDAEFSLMLAAGTYYAIAGSHGNYGDVGQYIVTVASDSPSGDPGPTLNELSAPTGLTVTATTATTAGLSWNSVGGATGYAVERSSDNVTFAQIGTTTGTCTFTNTGLAGAQSYFYRVRAQDGAGVSLPSNTVNATTRAGAVSNFTITSWTSSKLILNWIDASGETGYQIERSPNGVGNWNVLSTVGQNIPSYTNTGLTAGTRYYYRVVTLDGSGDAATSAVKYGTTTGGTNAAPTVATAASAVPTTVIGTTTNLSALGADDGGEANLTYTWLATSKPSGAADPSYTDNGSNAAKNTTATFSKAGDYTFQVTIADTGGLTVTSTVSVTVSQTLTSIAVIPPTAALNINQAQQFSATGYDQFGNALVSQPAFTWAKTSGVGSIDASGLYTAPAAGSATITATSGLVSGSASITVQDTAPTVATPAAATPNPVTGAATALSVLGADDGGEANLTYTWLATSKPSGAADPSYTVNGSNAAKNTTATFSKAGDYTFQVTIADTGGLTVTSTVSVTVTEAPIATWDGGGDDDNWMTAANWANDVAPVPGDRLVFSGYTRQSSTNDFSAGSFDSITFTNGGFTLSGSNAVTLNPLGGIAIDNILGQNKIDLPITLGSTCTFAVVRAGTLELGLSAQAPVFSSGGVDIQGGKLVFDYTGTSPATTIDGLLDYSYHGGPSGVGLWDQGQFRSSTAVDTGLTLGWTDSGTQVIVMATYAGDANLDGEVDGADVGLWKLNVGASGEGVTWDMADFNYDGEVDGADVDIWKLKVGASLGLLGLSTGGTGLSIVPEPGTPALLEASDIMPPAVDLPAPNIPPIPVMENTRPVANAQNGITDNLMSGLLKKGVRRQPALSEVDAVFAEIALLDGQRLSWASEY
jgi:hypothetical protein